MRILYHHRTRAEDGQAVHIRALQRAFASLGHEVREVAPVLRAASATASPVPGGWSWVDRLPRFARELGEYAYTLAARRSLTRAAREFRPDFVYERHAFGNAGGVLAARALGLPLVLEVNSPMVIELAATRGLSFPPLARAVERYVLARADLVCAVTGVLAEILVQAGARSDRVLVTQNGVELEDYAAPGDAAARARARTLLGLADDRGDPVLGFVGYYRDWHRLELAVRALTRPELSGARLVLVGEGPSRAAIEAEARAAGVAERVLYAAPRPQAEIPLVLPAFDVALLPAINPYASPLKLFEYMAAARAVIAPDQPNLREVLADGENALLFAAGDGAALADGLCRLARDSALRERLGARARATVVERDLTWRGNAARVVRAVEGLR